MLSAVIIFSILFYSSAFISKFRLISPQKSFHASTDDNDVFNENERREIREVNLFEELVEKLQSRIINLPAPDSSGIRDDLELKLSAQRLQLQYQDALQLIQKQHTLSEMEKLTLLLQAREIADQKQAESTMTEKDLKKNLLPIEMPSAPLYSIVNAPTILIAIGSGIVSQELEKMVQHLGSTGNFRFVKIKQLNILNEQELTYLLKDVNSIIIAGDRSLNEEGAEKARNNNNNWFNFGSKLAANNNNNNLGQELDMLLDARGLKRLLNAAMSELNQQLLSQPSSNTFRSLSSSSNSATTTKTTLPNTPPPTIKVIFLGRACKPSRSVASFLMGDTTDIESEFILQCTQRQLTYQIVKVGRLVDDSTDTNNNNQNKNAIKQLQVRNRAVFPMSSSSSSDPLASVSQQLQSPMVLTFSPIIEHNEITKVSHATEALLRAASSSQRNISSVYSLLSIPQLDRQPTTHDWNDELIKLDGPELIRYPLQFATIQQGNIWLQQLSRRLQSKKVKLITPINIETYSNALRIVFKPVQSEYQSSKEEKFLQRLTVEQQQQEEEEQQKKAATAAVAVQTTMKQKSSFQKRASGYLPPELEQSEIVMFDNDSSKMTNNESNSGSNTPQQQQQQQASTSQKKKKDPLEGGLDIILESSPYPRIRIRRCLLGPGTIIKEESEKVILELVEQAIDVWENDYRLLRSALQSK
jgi:hypothetical protein